MRPIPLCLRLGLIISLAWLVVALGIVFDRSDPDDVTFRIWAHQYNLENGPYHGCGGSPPPKLDQWESINYDFNETMSSICGSIADWRGETSDLFAWVRRQEEKRVQRPCRVGTAHHELKMVDGAHPTISQ